MILAVLMVFGSLSCLGTVASAAYNHDADQNGNPTNWNRPFDPDETYQIKTTAQLDALYGSTPYLYTGIAVYEFPDDEYDNGAVMADLELTDHYVNPGSPLRLYYYIKSNYYLANFNWDIQFDKTMFAPIGQAYYKKSAQMKYNAANDLSGVGIYNQGLTSKNLETAGGLNNGENDDEDVTGHPIFCAENEDGVVPEIELTYTVLNGCKISTYTTANTGMATDLYYRWEVARMSFSINNPIEYPECIPLHNPTDPDVEVAWNADDWVYYIDMAVRDEDEITYKGTADASTVGECGYVDEGTVAYFGQEPKALKANYRKGLSDFQLASFVEADNGGDDVYSWYNINGMVWDYEDLNHSFIIGEPVDPDTVWKITYDVDGGTAIPATNVTKGQSTTLPSAVRGDDTFLGWATTAGGAVAYAGGASYTPNANVTLYAIYQAAPTGYDVTFTDYASFNQTNVESIVLPTPEAQLNKRFIGWNDGTTTTAAGETYTVTANTTFTAVWADLYTVTFVDGQEVLGTAQFAEGDDPAVLATQPTKPGNTFGGYEYSPALVNGKMPAGNVTASVVWNAQTFTITYNAMSGSSVAPVTYAYGAVVAEATTTREGYTFGGWTYSPALGEGNTMPAANVTATASWTINQYTITYVTDGSPVNDATYNYNAVVETANSTKTGYTLTGWTYNPPLNEGKMPASDVTATANWQAESYTVVFQDRNGGKIGQATGDYGTAITFPEAPEVTGMRFVGWSKDGGATKVTSAVFEGNDTYKAYYGDQVYTATYMVGDEVIDTQTYNYGDIINTSAVSYTAPEGMTFSGWSSEYTQMPAEDIVITGTVEWIPYTVIYKVDGVTYATFNEGLHLGSNMPVPTTEPEKEGYVFLNWDNTASTITGSLTTITINATWQVESYYLEDASSIDGNGFEVTYGQVLTAEDFADLGADQEGKTTVWTWGEDGQGEAIVFPYTVGDLGEDHETFYIYPTYTSLQYTITYYKDGRIYDSQSYAYGAGVTAVALPTTSGYDFTEWCSDADCQVPYTFPATMPAENIVVYTKGTPHLYTNTYYDIDGTTPLYTRQVRFGEAIEHPECPERAGYTNLYWDPAKDTQEAMNMTFTLKGGAGKVNYTVTFITEDLEGNTTTESVTRNDTNGRTVSVSSNDVTKTGYEVDQSKSVLSGTCAPGLELIVYFVPSTFTITWIDEDGETPVNYRYGEAVTIRTAAEKTGHSAGEWSYVKTERQTPVSAPVTMPEYDITATVTYTPNKYDVNFWVDGEKIATVQTTYATKIASRADEVREGYTFSGWCSDAACTTPYVFGGDMPAEAVDIYGKFTINTYTIKYYVDGEQYGETETYEYGAQVTPVAEPTKTGYTFQGWDKTIPATMGAANIETNATWVVNKYNLTYVDEDGQTVFKTVKVTYNEEPAAYEPADKVGYTFTEWTYAPELVAGKMPANDVTATANWAKDSFTATFYMVDVEGEPYATVENVPYNDPITAPADPERTNYTFKGWKKLGTSAAIAPADLVMDAEGLVFVGAWEQDTSACFITGFERITQNYYAKGAAKYEVTVSEPADRIIIREDNDNGKLNTYTKASWVLSDDGVEVTEGLPVSGVYNIVTNADGSETWTVDAVIAAGQVSVYTVLVSGLTDADNAREYEVTYDAKSDAELTQDIVSRSINLPEGGCIVRGNSYTWTVVTSDEVSWLKFVGTYPVDGGTEKKLTILYKAATYLENPTDTAAVVHDENAGTYTWTLTVKFTYSVDMDKIVETWKMYYRVGAGTEYFCYDDAEGVEPVVITVGKNADAFVEPTPGYDKYTLVSASCEAGTEPVALNARKNITIVTTDDCTKVRISVNSKNATYQEGSTNTTVTTENGLKTWVISYKFTQAGSNEYSVATRGTAWTENPEIFVVTVE